MNSFDSLKSLSEVLEQKNFSRKDWMKKTLKDDMFYFVSLGAGVILLIIFLLLFNIINLVIPIPRFIYNFIFIVLIPVVSGFIFVLFLNWNETRGREDVKIAEQMMNEAPKMKKLLKLYREAEYYDELDSLEDEYYEVRSEYEYIRRQRIRQRG